MAEQALCVRAKAGDRAALGDLLTRHGPRIYRNVLLPRLGTVPLAEEALAATYLEALKSFSNFQWLGFGIYPWLRQVALRVALRAIRKSAGESLCDPSDIARELEDSPTDSLSLGDQHDRDKARRYVERALEGLSTQHAEALRLRLLEDRPREELAGKWGCSLNAVDQRVHRAKEALRGALRAQNDAGHASPLIFVLVDGGSGPTPHVFNRAKVSLGRAPSCDLLLPGEGVSRRHAILGIDESGHFVMDLGSSNGTLLRGARLAGRARIAFGESLRVGGYVLSLVSTPLLSLWARALLAEASADGASAAEAEPVSTGALPLTAPLSQVLRRAAQAPADSRGSHAGEERIESLLHSAWQTGDLDGGFNERAVEAVLLTSE